MGGGTKDFLLTLSNPDLRVEARCFPLCASVPCLGLQTARPRVLSPGRTFCSARGPSCPVRRGHYAVPECWPGPGGDSLTDPQTQWPGGRCESSILSEHEGQWGQTHLKIEPRAMRAKRGSLVLRARNPEREDVRGPVCGWAAHPWTPESTSLGNTAAFSGGLRFLAWIC